MRESNETSTTPWNLTLSVPLPFCTFQSPTQRRKKSFDVRQPNPCTLHSASQISLIICLYSRHFVIYRGLLLNESGKWCIMHNIDVWHPNRCIPDEIDLFYFKTCIITHNNNVIEQNINVSMFDILSVKKPHRSLSILNRALKQTTLKAHYGSRKGTIQKYFANPKKYSESLSIRQIAFEKVVKSRKQFQILV